MHIKSPLKKEKVKQNKRQSPSDKRTKRTPGNSSGGNGSNYGRRLKDEQEKQDTFSWPSLKPWKIIVGALILGLLGMAYLKHVFATQELLREVQQLEREYQQVKRMHDTYRLRYDRLIGPTQIYENAKNAGFINGGPAEKVIEVEK